MFQHRTSKAWTIRPFVGAGPLSFGLSRAEVRTLLDSNYESYRHGPFATNLTEAFDEIGIHAEFDENDKLELIEGMGNAAIEFSEVTLLGVSIFDLLQTPTIRKLNYLYENGMYIFESAGFSLYVEEDTVKSVGVFRKGYYD